MDRERQHPRVYSASVAPQAYARATARGIACFLSKNLGSSQDSGTQDGSAAARPEPDALTTVAQMHMMAGMLRIITASSTKAPIPLHTIFVTG